MNDLYKLGQSQQGELKEVSEEIRLDLNLEENPFSNTGSITGNVKDPDGNPVSGVLIKVLDKNNNPLYHTLTDKDGNYDLTNIPVASDLKLGIVKEGYLLNETSLFSIAANQIITTNEVITPNPKAALSTITAHLYDNQGNALGGVLATLSKIVNGEEVSVSVTTTNEYGQLAFINVELGSYIIRTTKQGYDPSTLEVIVTKPSSIINVTITAEISLIDSQGTINGVIRDSNGTPVVGAVVILYSVSGSSEDPIYTPIRYTRTIEGGAYLFGDVPQGKYIIKSNKEN